MFLLLELNICGTIVVMDKILTKAEATNLSALVLAHVGDAVFSLYIRAKLATEHDFKAGELHKLASNIVSAKSQAVFADKILPILTEEELDIYHRGRNGKFSTVAKNQTRSDYEKASGFEAVLGYLYLIGNETRLQEVLELCQYQ